MMPSAAVKSATITATILFLVSLSTLPYTGAIMPPSTTSSSVVFPEAQHFVSKDHVQYEFSSSAPPVVKVDPCDLVHVQTHDCFHGMVQPNSLSSWKEQQQQQQQQQQRNNSDHDGGSGGGIFINGSILDDIPRSKRNPVTGPIFVNGARAGDILAVTLVDIRPQGIGIACCGSTAGQLCGWMKKDSTTIKFFDLSQCGTIVTMRDFKDGDNKDGIHSQSRQPHHHRRRRLGPISFPASPMLGVIGVAPSDENDPIGTIPAGKHGGNLDNNCNGIGSTVYIPVNHPGALLSIGDMHASQGDGEISGTGVEIGGDVLLRCRVLRQEDLYGRSFDENDNDGDDRTTEISSSSSLTSLSTPSSLSRWKLEYPVTETATHWITHGVVEGNIPQTTSIACQEAAKILVGQWGFTVEESFIFLSVKGNLGLCQACHPDIGTQIAKMSVPKLDRLCPRPFRILSSSSPTTS